jgi:hypothetical protein
MMEDLFATLLSGIVEILLEVFFQVAIEAVVAFVSRCLRNIFSGSNAISPVLAAAVYLLLGVIFGAVSVFVIPHPIMRPARIHGISLIVSPVITGLIMSQVGVLLRRNGKEAVRIESFAYGFTFALGVAAVRFAYLK